MAGAAEEHTWLDVTDEAPSTMLAKLLTHQPEAHARVLSKGTNGGHVTEKVSLSVRVDDKDQRRAVFQPEKRRAGKGKWTTFLQPTTLKLLRDQQYRIGIEVLDVGESIVAIDSFSIEEMDCTQRPFSTALRAEDDVRVELQKPKKPAGGEEPLEVPLEVPAYRWACKWTPPRKRRSTPDMQRELLWLRIKYFRAGESNARTLETSIQVKYYGERESERCCAPCLMPRHMMSLAVLPPRIDEHWDMRIELTSPDAISLDAPPNAGAARAASD